MKIEKTIVLALVVLTFTALTGCAGPAVLSIKNSSDSLEGLANTGSGRVHILPAVKGVDVVAVSGNPAQTNLTPKRDRNVHYVTNDDVVSAVNNASKDAIREAGYAVTAGNNVPEDADIVVAITVDEVKASNTLASFDQNEVLAIAKGDFGKKEDSILSGHFTARATGAVITTVVFTNKKSRETKTHLVSGAAQDWGLGSYSGAVENALNSAFGKFKANLVRALEAFQKGILK